jgi:membrane-bound lytic murein transglycosylase D
MGRLKIYAKKVIPISLLLILLGVTAPFASTPFDCCNSLQIHTPQSDVLLSGLPDLAIPARLEMSDHYLPTLNLSTALENSTGDTLPRNGEVAYDFPIVQNHFVYRQIALFQTVYRDQFQKGLARSGRYIPMMQEMLIEFNLPTDLVYLPLIESNFSVQAVSSAKATGPWQFIKGTGRRYGLRIDQWIDERRDPVKSTRAAAAYLKDLYDTFGSWLLSLASYNAGEGRIGRAIKRTNMADYWALKASDNIPRETRNYVPKFMAATIIAKSPEIYGFSVDYETPLLYDEVRIERQTSLHAIADAIGVSYEEIKFYNPELRLWTTPPNYSGYRLKLPQGKKKVFLANISKIKGPFSHRIKWGETLSSISRKYNVPVTQLLEINRLRKNSVIRAGHSILIPYV